MTIMAWREHRGVDNLMLEGPGDCEADKLPKQIIIEPGTGQYMDRVASCTAGTAMDPYNFKRGLQDYLDDRSP